MPIIGSAPAGEEQPLPDRDSRRARSAESGRLGTWARSASRPLALALVATALLLWILPSNVPRLIARQDDVLLGRYSEAHLVAAVLASLILGPAAFTVPGAACARKLTTPSSTRRVCSRAR